MKDVLDYEIDFQIRAYEALKEIAVYESSKKGGDDVILTELPEIKHYMENMKSLTKTVRRTLVITKKTLKNLKKLSEELNLTRDEVINNVIIKGKEDTEEKDEAEIDNYQEALKIINELVEESHNVEAQVKKLLSDGEDDHIFESIWMSILDLEDASEKIEDEIKKREK